MANQILCVASMGRGDESLFGFGTQCSVPFKIMINCPLSDLLRLADLPCHFPRNRILKKLMDFQKTLMSYHFFCKKPFLVKNFAKVAETLRMKINIDIVRTLGSRKKPSGKVSRSE